MQTGVNLAKAQGGRLKRVAAGARPSEPKEERSRIVVERPARPLTPAMCRRWVRKTMAAHMPDVLEGFLNAAVAGSSTHLKLATETVAPTTATTRRKGRAERMLENWEREMTAPLIKEQVTEAPDDW